MGVLVKVLSKSIGGYPPKEIYPPGAIYDEEFERSRASVKVGALRPCETMDLNNGE